MTNPKYSSRELPTTKEIQTALSKADTIYKDEFQRLRVKAVISLVYKFGKRRSEITRLKMSDLKTEKDFLHITFTISKKHKKGLFQYIKAQQKLIKKGTLTQQILDNKTHSQLRQEWQEWTQTREGQKTRQDTRTKRLALKDTYCQHIIDYYEYMKNSYPDVAYLFPRSRYSFGKLVRIDKDKPVSGRHLLRIIKPLDTTLWLHLFREGFGAKIAIEQGNTVTSVAMIKEYLDLENESTAWNYVRRHSIQTIPTET